MELISGSLVTTVEQLQFDSSCINMNRDAPTFGIAETTRPELFGLSLPKLPTRTDLQNQRPKSKVTNNKHKKRQLRQLLDKYRAELLDGKMYLCK